MNKLILFSLAAFLSCTLANAQISGRGQQNYNDYKTVFGNRSSIGAYGAISLGYSMIDGRDALMAGGRAEMVMGHGFGFGVGGNGFINDPVYNSTDDLYYSLAGGYGGLVLEPIILWHLPVHLSFPVMLGAGAVALTSFSDDLYDPYQYFDSYLEDVNIFLVAEPGVELELNILRFFRLAIYGTYRFTSTILMDNSSSNALNGWSSGITFKFGAF